MGGRRRGAGGVPRSASLSDDQSAPPGARKGGRKMSLSCLANSILSLEKGRRRAVSNLKIHSHCAIFFVIAIAGFSRR